MNRIDKSAVSHPGFSHGIQVAAFHEHLGDDEIGLVCRNLGHTWRDRIFTPAVTVRSMVHHALNPDKSIRAVLKYSHFLCSDISVPSEDALAVLRSDGP